MKRLRLYFSRLPIRWKLTIWSTLLLCLLFVTYNIIQHVVLTQWILHYEDGYVSKKAAEIQTYLENEKGLTSVTLPEQKRFLESLNEQGQVIRVLDTSGHMLLSITHDLPADWVAPRAVNADTVERVQYLGDDWLVYRAPIRTADFQGTLEIVRNLGSIDQVLQLNLIVLIVGTVGGVALSWLGGSILTRRFLAPLTAVSDTMKRIKDGGLGQRVHIENNGDEITELAGIFNDMMNRLERSFQQQKQFVEDASHELRTPVAILQGHLSMLNRWGKNDPAVLEESLAAMTSETVRLNKLVLELLELTRAEHSQHFPAPAIPVAPVIKRVAENLTLLHPETALHLHLEEASDAEALINAEHLEQILVILLDNAIKYSQPNHNIDILVEREPEATAISVRDYGEGIPEEELSFLFDRFYRVDKARSRQIGGTGLGLPIAQRLANHYGGTISIDSQIGTGTTVTLRLPLNHTKTS